jgi:hypothetical protein
MLYPKHVINELNQWIEGNEDARDWLESNGYEELVMLKDAVSRHAKPFEYLLTNKFVILAAFVNAIWEDDKAFRLLMDQKAFHWAAVANYINGDDKAGNFLKQNRLEHYLQLGHLIQQKIRQEGDEGTNFFNSGPFKI